MGDLCARALSIRKRRWRLSLRARAQVARRVMLLPVPMRWVMLPWGLLLGLLLATADEVIQ